jgi:hypothetical protein
MCCSFLLMACQTPSEKINNAKVEVATANQDLKDARREVRADWQEEWLTFKRGNDTAIAENERRFIELRGKTKDVAVRDRTSYAGRIDACEVRNNELRDRVNSYKDGGDASWQEFKKTVGRDMDELKIACRDIPIAKN